MSTILIIDDEPMVRVAVSLILESRGWSTVQAADGREGLAKAREQLPDLVVCDLNMPVLDGFETLNELRRDPMLQRIPCIVITGQTGSDNERRALQAGARAVLLKPFHNQALVDAVEHHLRHGDAP